ncbi:MAG: hypothetical protein JWN67_1615 [Actinomycetia bacterium]|nr:hypothetical protein [Actinomycetes bacterium]
MILPTFVIAGAPRCGTTSLHYYLRQHPQLCMSAIKEPNHFLFGPDGRPHIAEAPIIRKSIQKLSAYSALFRPTAATKAIGEASPLYLYTEPTPAQILAVCGVLQVVCVLRRPADRAWSHFTYATEVPPEKRHARFAELVDAEMRAGPGYEPYQTRTHLVRLGRYAEQVRRYQQTFGAENLHVLLMEDFNADRAASLSGICGFLGVEDDFAFDLSQRFNPAGIAPSNPFVRRVVRRVTPTIKAVLPNRLAGRLAEVRMGRASAASSEPAPAIDPEVARRIADWCADDVDELARLLGRDLSSWQESPAG